MVIKFVKESEKIENLLKNLGSELDTLKEIMDYVENYNDLAGNAWKNEVDGEMCAFLGKNMSDRKI